MPLDDNIDDISDRVTLSISITKEQKLAIDRLCKSQNTTLSWVIMTMIDTAIVNKNTNIKDNNFSLSKNKMNTEEMMVAMIYFEFAAKNQPFNMVVDTLSETHNVPVTFILHCIGKMLLSGIKLDEIKL